MSDEETTGEETVTISKNEYELLKKYESVWKASIQAKQLEAQCGKLNDEIIKELQVK